MSGSALEFGCIARHSPWTDDRYLWEAKSGCCSDERGPRILRLSPFAYRSRSTSLGLKYPKKGVFYPQWAG